MADGEQSPGWDAITRAAEQHYGDQEPRHWGTLIKWALGGPDPLDGVSCWEAVDHWHYVSYGLSELYEKSSSIAEESGFGWAALLLLLLLLFTISGLNLALRVREPAGRLIAVGATTLLASQALLNLGVAVGLLPTTVVTFPFVSYGGSSLISSMICLGLIINIGARRAPNFAADRFNTKTTGVF